LWADQISAYADEIRREAGFRKCSSPVREALVGDRGKKMARRKEGVSGGLEDEHGAYFSNLIPL
jgi:hypothetical protein